jgi:hypothetical protein
VRFLSFLLAAVAAAALILGIAVKLMGGQFVMGIAPVTLWRFTVALLGFAIYLNMYARQKP